MGIQESIRHLKDSILLLNGVHSILISASPVDEYHLEIRVVLNKIEEDLWNRITTIVEQQEQELRDITRDRWFLDVSPTYP